MATAEPLALPTGESNHRLARHWRHLAWAATAVAVLTSPALILFLTQRQGWMLGWALLATLGAVVAFRGAIDLLLRRAIPWPSLFGEESPRLREEDVVARRRVWFWRFWRRVAILVGLVVSVVYVARLLFLGAPGTGKTMLAKAIATGFNCPFVSIPGSVFAFMIPGGMGGGGQLALNQLLVVMTGSTTRSSCGGCS